MNQAFEIESYFPEVLFHRITEVRVREPDRVTQEAARRKRRSGLTHDGKLVVLAADHPGRLVTSSGTDPLGMADRYQLLGRILRVLTQPEIDGVMGTPDILEELLILNCLVGESGGPSFLDDKVMMGCMNRGGLAGAVFEMNDRFGAFTPGHLEKMGFDAAKMMFRLDLENPDSGATIQECAEALRDLAARNIPAFLEPLPVERTDSGYRVQKTAPALARVVGVATALGDSSRLLWLKIPCVEDYALVARATTCPILMLGGEARGRPGELLQEFSAGLAAGPNVRGLLVGRNILFPGDHDPGAVAAAAGRMVHAGISAKSALEVLEGFRDDRSLRGRAAS